MNREQYLLTKLAEEAVEVAQIVLKTQQFGMDEVCPDLPFTNKQRCHQELNDLLAIIEMLNNEFEFGFQPSWRAMKAKEDKVNKYYIHSKNLGMVT